MKRTNRVFFLVAICFALISTAYAEGDLPNGTRNCTGNCLTDSGTIEVKVSEEKTITDSIFAEFKTLFVKFFE